MLKYNLKKDTILDKIKAFFILVGMILCVIFSIIFTFTLVLIVQPFFWLTVIVITLIIYLA